MNKIQEFIQGVENKEIIQNFKNVKTEWSTRNKIATAMTNLMTQYKLSDDNKITALKNLCINLNDIGVSAYAFLSTGEHFTGDAIIVGTGRWSLDPNYASSSAPYAHFANNRTNSVFVMDGYQVKLFTNGVNGVGRNYTVKSPGLPSLSDKSINFANQLSSFTVENPYTESQIDSLRKQQDALMSQLLAENSKNVKEQSELSNMQDEIVQMSEKVEDLKRDDESESKLTPSLDKKLKMKKDSINTLIEEDHEKELKARIMTLETFENMQDRIKHSDMTTTILLSALVSLLTVTMIGLLKK